MKNVMESLKYTNIKQVLLNYIIYDYGSHHYFRGNALLKKIFNCFH